MEKLGFLLESDVPKYVAHIIRTGTPLFYSGDSFTKIRLMAVWLRRRGDRGRARIERAPSSGDWPRQRMEPHMSDLSLAQNHALDLARTLMVPVTWGDRAVSKPDRSMALIRTSN